MINTIIGEMDGWDIVGYSVLVIVNLALLLAASAPAIVIKILLLTPDIIDMSRSTVGVIEKCD